MTTLFKPQLILVCAVSGAGKSIFSRKLELELAGAVRLSSDELRGIVGKDENDQSVSFIVFRTMETMAEYLLRKGRPVIIDATNYHIKARKSFIDIAKKVGVPTVAYILDRSLDVLKAQNQKRERQVPDGVIEKQFNNFVHPVVGEVDEVNYV